MTLPSPLSVKDKLEEAPVVNEHQQDIAKIKSQCEGVKKYCQSESSFKAAGEQAQGAIFADESAQKQVQKSGGEPRGIKFDIYVRTNRKSSQIVKRFLKQA